jgi:hypothetical protein
MSADVLESLRTEIAGYQHAVQTGVGLVNECMDDRGECSPKHLRVGVNSAIIDGSALAKLLIDKGVITEIEYFRAVRDLWKAEYEDYRAQARAKLHNPSLEIG